MTEAELNECLRQNPDLVTADMDGEKVMMSVVNGQYFGINAVGARVWDLLEPQRSIGEICRQITEEFEVDAAQCRSDVLTFLAELRAHDIVRSA